MEIKGTITNALPEQSGTSKSGKSWRKKEYIVEYEHGQYPKSVVFSVMGQKIDELNIQQGAEYNLSIDFEAREWNNRYFLQASCWRATPAQQPQQAPAQQGWEQMYQQPTPQPQTPKDDMGNDLPF